MPKPANGAVNKISPGLAALAVDLDSLVPDPMNARLHPERNMEAIKASLQLYGQVKPLVVRAEGRVIVAGNGTWAAAKALGWTRIAANVQSMTEAEAAGYGLADNRTSELARWDLAVVARVGQLLEELGEGAVGWTEEEMAVARTSSFAAPPEGGFPEVGEDIDTEHECPRCGYRWSGGA